jgi:hypothetical protein
MPNTHSTLSDLNTEAPERRGKNKNFFLGNPGVPALKDHRTAVGATVDPVPP